MYKKILSEIFKQNGVSNPDAQANYLRSLRPSARALWQAYQSQAVAVNYAEPAMQEAYLLRYFVPYSHLLPTVLQHLETKGIGVSATEDLLTACFFGCGPGPEIVGLIRHLKRKAERPEMLIARMFDIASASWQHSRAIVKNSILVDEWDGGLIEIDPAAADISALALSPQNDGARRKVQEADLVVFQNCLNELSTTALAAVANNLRALLNTAKKNATLVLIERDGYAATDEMLLDLYKWAATQAGTFSAVGELSAASELNCRDMLDQIPEIVTMNLFVRKRDMSQISSEESGLILAASVKYKWLAISKLA
ncbi:MAG: hypothetical protein ACT4OH_02135 [Methylophilaceae bacterium]